MATVAKVSGHSTVVGEIGIIFSFFVSVRRLSIMIWHNHGHSSREYSAFLTKIEPTPLHSALGKLKTKALSLPAMAILEPFFV